MSPKRTTVKKVKATVVSHIRVQCPMCGFYNETLLDHRLRQLDKNETLDVMLNNGIATCEYCLMDYEVDLKGVLLEDGSQTIGNMQL